MTEFNPTHTFISTGQKTAMYTLREAGYLTTAHGTVYHDYYICNLANDRERALEKAAEISGEYGIPLRTDGELFSLNEIRRRASEEVDAVRNERIKAEQERNEKENSDYAITLSEGMVLLGKYAGKTVEEIVEFDLSYIKWLARQYQQDSITGFNVGAKLAHDWVELNVQKSTYIGDIGNKLEFTGKVESNRAVNGFYGSSNCITVIDSDGILVRFYSTSKKSNTINSGDLVLIAGNVKSHDVDYVSREQVTILSGRIKIEVEVE